MKVDSRKLDLLLAVQCKSMTNLRNEGLSPKTLTRIRRGEEVKPKTLGTLAKALGVSPEAIIKQEVAQ